jgi:hypothetical protein
MSAETMKMPDPIIEPATSVTESKRESPGFKRSEDAPGFGSVAIGRES